MKTAIIIPARYLSTRLPGKPLAIIQGQTMLSRVVKIAQTAAKTREQVAVMVATDDERIMEHTVELGVQAVMTSPDAPTGTDRVAEAVMHLDEQPDFILNLQGDAPLTPPEFLTLLMDAFKANPCDVVTPVTQLSWEALDKLREQKVVTPFSGTTAVFNQASGKAFWFSKAILPIIRKEKDLRTTAALSPVYRHIGIYGYALSALQQYVKLKETMYEKLEGLEQLRMLENGFDMRCVQVDFKGRANMSGVDSPEDVLRAEKLILEHGELC